MKYFEGKIDTLIDKLSHFVSVNQVFNPWKDTDETDNPSVDAVLIRRENLKKYLIEHKNAKYVL